MSERQTLGEWYLANADGDLLRYHQQLRHGYRIGQAFFNALSALDRQRIAGTLADPFHRHSAEAVSDAIEFLTRPSRSPLESS